MRALLTKAKTWLSRRLFRNYHKAGKTSAIGLWMLGIDKTGAYLDSSAHPLHATRAEQYRSNIAVHPAPQIIAFGDSLKDIPRGDFQHLAEHNNFSISGSRSHHMLEMAREIQAELITQNKLGALEYLHIGTLEGNGFLMGAPLEHALERSLHCLTEVRKLFPRPRFIVDLLPPTYSPYANLSRPAFETRIMQWIAADGNAAAIGFHSMGTTTPNLTLSSDGVHFTPEGVRRFDEAMERARRRSPGTLVQA